jgi:hypothetical protein
MISVQDFLDAHLEDHVGVRTDPRAVSCYITQHRVEDGRGTNSSAREADSSFGPPPSGAALAGRTARNPVARLGGVFSKRDHEFESAFLQRGVRCEPDFLPFIP